MVIGIIVSILAVTIDDIILGILLLEYIFVILFSVCFWY